MRVLPVLDVLNQVVVRGVAGQRERYRPVDSVLCASPEPLVVARAIRSALGLDQLYVADLDAILHDAPNIGLWRDLVEDGFELMIDAGVKLLPDAETVLAAGIRRVIVGLETWPLLSSLELLVNRLGPERVVFSLDLREGRLARSFGDMTSSDPLNVALAVIECGIREIIVLDVATVGTYAGTSTDELIARLRTVAPQATIFTGGGVRDVSDLIRLRDQGVNGILVASAFHNGMISRMQLISAGLVRS